MDNLIALGKAISDPTRLRILNALLQSDLCVCELVDALQVSQPNLSTHLQILKRHDIVLAEKRRTWIIYSVNPELAGPLRELFRGFPTQDVRISEDNERLEQRLGLRIDGCCVQGMGALTMELPRGETVGV